MIAMIEAGLAVTPERYDAARALARSCRAALADVFDGIDVVLAPSTVGEAPEGIEATGDPLFNRMWTLLHVPCIHLPVGRGPRGLPVGVTVAGPLGADRATLAGGGLDLREALTSSLPALGPDWEHCRSYWIASSARRALAASRRRRRMPRFEMSSCVLQEQ